MDPAPLLQWLGLPPGPWPPDDRALLGLPPAPAVASAAEAEQQALARMETLRPHQLLHPELVTEGMNRLAQALIAVMAAAPPAESPPAPARPRRAAKARAKPKPEPLPPPEYDFRPTPAPEPLPLPPPDPQPSRVVIFDAEIVEAAPQPLPPIAVAPAPKSALPPVPLALPEPPEGTNYFPADRRAGYRELVFLRRLKAVWELLRPTLGDAKEPLTSAEAVFALLSGARELAALRKREEFGRVIRGDAEAVAAVAVQPAVLTVLRELVPSQRWGLAVGWDVGRVAIDQRERWLRQRMRESKPPRRASDGEVAEFFRANPEWVLVALTVLLLAVGVARAVIRNPG